MGVVGVDVGNKIIKGKVISLVAFLHIGKLCKLRDTTILNMEIFNRKLEHILKFSMHSDCRDHLSFMSKKIKHFLIIFYLFGFLHMIFRH